MQSQTIVRKVQGGRGHNADRFIILQELAMAAQGFAFEPIGVAMTMDEVCAALVAHGISEADALALINEAVANFRSP